MDSKAQQDAADTAWAVGGAMPDRVSELEPARREAVYEAALDVFGRRGYGRALTGDIAREAGMSKGLLFFYFHNKKDLYLRLVDHLMDKVTELVVDDGFWEINDFFELLLYAGRKRGAVMRRFPRLLDFSLRAYYPEHSEIRDALNAWTQRQTNAMLERFFKNVDFGRFKDDVDPLHVIELLVWLADGYLHQERSRGHAIDLDDLLAHLEEWCHMLRSYAYKEEYL